MYVPKIKDIALYALLLIISRLAGLICKNDNDLIYIKLARNEVKLLFTCAVFADHVNEFFQKFTKFQSKGDK